MCPICRGGKATPPTNYELILDIEHLQQVSAAGSRELIAIDMETTSIDYIKAELVGFSFAVISGGAAYCPSLMIIPVRLSR